MSSISPAPVTSREDVGAALARCGVALDGVPAPGAQGLHPDLDWALSGAMELTGEPDGPPRLAPAPLASRARRLVAALRELSGADAFAGLDGPALLGERAACFGLGRRGRTAPGGSCRLVPCADGWLAVNLARQADRELLPAWLEAGGGVDAWSFVARHVARRPTRELVERARLIGLPVAAAAAPPATAPPWARVSALGAPDPGLAARRPLVVDLSSLWAGPLCGHLLLLSGARVVKVESSRRPDGARFGAERFFDLLNAGKQSVALDFGAEGGREQLRRLVERADVVIESARPRALRQLGVDAEAWVRNAPGRVWVSLTGYGRAEPDGSRVAFGDDAAAAAGLAIATGAPGPPLFCGDAIADPLAGLHAAVATLAALRSGGGFLLDVPLRDGVAHVLAGARGAREGRVERRAGGFEVVVGAERAPVRPPWARQSRVRARAFGADTAAVLAERC